RNQESNPSRLLLLLSTNTVLDSGHQITRLSVPPREDCLSHQHPLNKSLLLRRDDHKLFDLRKRERLQQPLHEKRNIDILGQNRSPAENLQESDNIVPGLNLVSPGLDIGS